MELLRDFQRAWVCIAARCQDHTPVLVTNLSVSGAQVQGIAPVAKRYKIEIPIVHGTVLKLQAENIWIKKNHFGLKFLEITDRELSLLRSLLWAHRREDQEI